MEPSQLTLLYNTMVLPHLQYCIINWGNFKEDHNLKLRDKLLSLQKCFLRIIHGALRLSHADPLLAKMGALKIDDLFTQAVRIFAFRWTKNMLPATMATLLQKINHSHHTRGSQSNLRVNCSDLRSIASIAPKHWNSLTSDLKQLPSIGSFKANSKKNLIHPYSLFSCNSRKCLSCHPSPPSSP